MWNKVKSISIICTRCREKIENCENHFCERPLKSKVICYDEVIQEISGNQTIVHHHYCNLKCLTKYIATKLYHNHQLGYAKKIRVVNVQRKGD